MDGEAEEVKIRFVGVLGCCSRCEAKLVCERRGCVDKGSYGMEAVHSLSPVVCSACRCRTDKARDVAVEKEGDFCGFQVVDMPKLLRMCTTYCRRLFWMCGAALGIIMHNVIWPEF